LLGGLATAAHHVENTHLVVLDHFNIFFQQLFVGNRTLAPDLDEFVKDSRHFFVVFWIDENFLNNLFTDIVFNGLGCDFLALAV